jgi:hypothetical protein
MKSYKSKPTYVKAVRLEPRHTLKDIQNWLTQAGLNKNRVKPEKSFFAIDTKGDGGTWSLLLNGMWLVMDSTNARIVTTTTNERFVNVFEPADGEE